MVAKSEEDRRRAAQRVKLACTALSIAMQEASDLGLTVKFKVIEVTVHPRRIVIQPEIVRYIRAEDL